VGGWYSAVFRYIPHKNTREGPAKVQQKATKLIKSIKKSYIKKDSNVLVCIRLREDYGAKIMGQPNSDIHDFKRF